ncbi:MAG: Gfo/Idh/MocA family oxidoreductase [Chloroflexi bacterium]|nr:Gfo/Idh/MocA family oxidoreductase [Chloroflexota bacterium]
MTTIDWGIIGIGKHADRRMAPAFPRTSNSRLVAVCSRDQSRATAFATHHGAEAGYDSYERLLGHPGVQVVYVATPHSLHRAHVLQAAEAGKHVLCEKPMALTVPDAEAMVAACRRAGVVLGVCFQNRYHPAHVEVRRLVADGRVGRVLQVRAQFSRLVHGDWQGWRADPAMTGAGCLMGMGVHPLDLVRYVTGEEVTEVSAMMDQPPAGASVDYAVAALLRLSGGGFAVVDNSHRSPWADNDLVLYGSQARVAGRGTVGTLLRGGLELVSEGVSLRADYPDADPATGLYARMIEDFSRCVVEDRPPAVTGDDGLAMTRITEAILCSVREGRAVPLADGY